MLSVFSVFIRFMKKENDQDFLLTLYTFLFKRMVIMTVVDMFRSKYLHKDDKMDLIDRETIIHFLNRNEKSPDKLLIFKFWI